MTSTLLPPEAARLAKLSRVSAADALELACKAHLGVWTERKRGMVNAPLHWEWAELAMTVSRLAVVAPREHAKSETFTVNQIAWRCTYQPALWCYVFCESGDQAKLLKAKIDAAIGETAPWMTAGQLVDNETESVYANWSRVSSAGVGKAVRGGHPDIIVADDVLSEANTMTAAGRRKLSRWWFGTVAGMAHPGTVRTLGELEDEQGRTIVLAKAGEPVRVPIPPTRIHAVGTPFHRQDLLLSMKNNPLYYFRRYAAEFAPGDLVPGTLAVEAS